MKKIYITEAYEIKNGKLTKKKLLMQSTEQQKIIFFENIIEKFNLNLEKSVFNDFYNLTAVQKIEFINYVNGSNLQICEKFQIINICKNEKIKRYESGL